MYYKRRGRKNDSKQRGEKLFGFREDDEYMIFRYATGEWLNIWEYRKVKKMDCTFDSIAEWRRYIRKKYMKCDKAELSDYINHQKEKQKTLMCEKEVALPIVTALFLAEPIKKIYEFGINLLVEIDKTNMNNIVRSVCHICIMIPFMILLVWLMLLILSAIRKSIIKSTKTEFYREFMDVLQIESR